MYKTAALEPLLLREVWQPYSAGMGHHVNGYWQYLLHSTRGSNTTAYRRPATETPVAALETFGCTRFLSNAALLTQPCDNRALPCVRGRRLFSVV